MSENAPDEFPQDAPQEDSLVDDIPRVAPTDRQHRRMSGGSFAALALSLVVHLAAGAAVLRWVIFNRQPSLVMQGGAGMTDFGSGVDGGEGMRDQLAELPGDSSAGTQAAVSVATALPDLQADATMTVVAHDVGDMVPQTDAPFFPPTGSAASGLPANFPNRPPKLALASAAGSPSAMPADKSAAAPPAQRGVGGNGGNGAGGGAGRNGSGAPAGLPGNRPPVYPRGEFRRGVTGTVKLRIIILEDGETGDVSIAESSGVPALDESAVSAARAWRWTPMFEDGQPVRVEVIKPVVFEIHDRTRG